MAPPVTPRRVNPDKLLAAMEDAGLRQVELAAMVDATQSQISDWLKGARPPERDNFDKLAQALQRPLEHFLDPPVGHDLSRHAGDVGTHAQTEAASARILKRECRAVLAAIVKGATRLLKEAETGLARLEDPQAQADSPVRRRTGGGRDRRAARKSSKARKGA
jgi:transcriptional regulator with XRE-family HTH domain